MNKPTAIEREKRSADSGAAHGSAFPSCVTCLHYRKPTSFVWKEDWPLLCLPVIGWIVALITWLMPKTPWCVAGHALCGEPDDDGPPCHKMRCFGACGAEAKLYTPNAELKHGANNP